MKVADKINARVAEGKPFFSFEFFPPRTEEVRFGEAPGGCGNASDLTPTSGCGGWFIMRLACRPRRRCHMCTPKRNPRDARCVIFL